MYDVVHKTKSFRLRMSAMHRNAIVYTVCSTNDRVSDIVKQSEIPTVEELREYMRRAYEVIASVLSEVISDAVTPEEISNVAIHIVPVSGATVVSFNRRAIRYKSNIQESHLYRYKFSITGGDGKLHWERLTKQLLPADIDRLANTAQTLTNV